MKEATPGLWMERILGLACLIGLIYSLWYLYRYYYLPQPFFYEVSDTWMDWFNTAYWAHNKGTYDNWRSIYPPISFIFLKATSLPGCYSFVESTTSRDCDWLSKVVMHAIFLLNIVLTWRMFHKLDHRTALPRTFALSCGLPMLYALDRGNLVTLCYTCLMLGCGPILRSARLRWFFLACAINFKVYLIAALFPHILRRRWRWFEGALLTTIGVYVITLLLYKDGTPGQIYRNIVDFAGIYQAVNFLDLTYSATYQPLLSLLQSSTTPTTWVIGSRASETLSWALPAYLHVAQALIALSAAAAWTRPEAVPLHRLVLSGVMMALMTAEGGGYTQPLFLMFVFMERWQGFGRPVALVLAYMLCIPGDIPLDWLPPLTRDSYLGQRPVEIQYMIAVGPLLRPGLIIAISIALSLTTLAAVWRDIKAKGWRHRWRYRHDAPLLVSPDYPEPLQAGDLQV